MKKTPKCIEVSDDVNDLSDTFKYIVQSMVITSFSRGKGDLTSLAAFLAKSAAVSRNLPTDKGALSCAIEFAAAHLPDFASDRAASDYEIPEWLKPHGPSDWIREAEEERIDGKWAPVNPRWVGLPSDRAAELDLMASLRDKPGQTVKQLERELNVTDTTVRARLARLEGLGFIAKSETRPERWSLKNPLPE